MWWCCIHWSTLDQDVEVLHTLINTGSGCGGAAYTDQHWIRMWRCCIHWSTLDQDVEVLHTLINTGSGCGGAAYTDQHWIRMWRCCIHWSTLDQDVEVLHTLINTGSAGGKRLRTRSVHTADGALCEVYKPSHRDEPLFLQGTQHCALLTQTSGLCKVSRSHSEYRFPAPSSKLCQI